MPASPCALAQWASEARQPESATCSGRAGDRQLARCLRAECLSACTSCPRPPGGVHGLGATSRSLSSQWLSSLEQPASSIFLFLLHGQPELGCGSRAHLWEAVGVNFLALPPCSLRAVGVLATHLCIHLKVGRGTVPLDLLARGLWTPHRCWAPAWS